MLKMDSSPMVATSDTTVNANDNNRKMIRIAVGSIAALVIIICLVIIIMFSGERSKSTNKSDNRGNSNTSPTKSADAKDNDGNDLTGEEMKLIEARLGTDGYKVLIPEGHVIVADANYDNEGAIGNVEAFYVVKEADADLPEQELPTAAVITMYLSITDAIQKELGIRGFFEESVKLPIENECSNIVFDTYLAKNDVAEYGEYSDDGSGCPVGSGKEGFGQRGVAINADILAADGQVLVINEVAGQDKQFAFEIATLKEIADYFYDHKYDDQALEE